MKNKFISKSSRKLAMYSSIGLTSFLLAAGTTFLFNSSSSNEVSAESVNKTGRTVVEGFMRKPDKPTEWIRDYIEPVTLGGRYVFCLEPTILNNSPNYRRTGDAISGVYYLRYSVGGSQTYKPTENDRLGLAVPYVLSYMSNSKVREIFGDDVSNINAEFSSMSAIEWYMPMQLGIWSNLRQINSVPTSLTFVSGSEYSFNRMQNVLQSDFASKWNRATQQIISVLKRGTFTRPDGSTGTIRYKGGSHTWIAPEVGKDGSQRMYEVDGIDFDIRYGPNKIKVRKVLDSNLNIYKSLKQFTLKGAVYELLKDGVAVQTATTNEEGIAEFTLPELSESSVGSYSVREKSAPTPTNTGVKVLAVDKNEYQLGSIVRKTIPENPFDPLDEDHVEIDDSNLQRDKEITSTETAIPRKGRLSIVKTGDIQETAFGAKLEGALFTVEFRETGSDSVLATLSYKTDSSGQIDLSNKSSVVSGMNDIASKMIDDGFVHVTARVTEVTPPPGHIIDDSSSRNMDIQFNGSDSQFSFNGSINFSNSANFLTLTKTQRNNSLLGGGQIDGAEFELSGTGGSKTATVQNGSLKFYNVTPGSYTLRESRPAVGYQKNDNTVSLNVDDKGVITYTGSTSDNDAKDIQFNAVNGSGKNALTVSAENTPSTANFDLKKINEKNRSLRSAKFRLTQLSSPTDKTSLSGPVRVGNNGQKEDTTDANGSINFTPKLVNTDGEDGLVIGAEYMLEETEAPQGYKLPRTRKRFYFTVNTNPNNNQYQINYRFDTNDKTSNSNEEWVRGEEKVVRLGETATFSTPAQSRELISSPEEIDTITMSLDQATKKLSINYQAMNMTRDKLPATGSSIMMIALGIGMTGLGAAAVYQLKRVKS